MGLLVDGVWTDQWYDTKASQGHFKRSEAQFRNWVTADGAAGSTGKDGFKAEKDRYHLFVSYACPWAHRTLIFRKLKALEDIGVSVVSPLMLENGWPFDPNFPDATPDHLFGNKFLYEVYLKADPKYSGRVTVPVLWDKKLNTVVSNESSEIIRMFNSAFDGVGAKAGDYYPEELRKEIDETNTWIYDTINNGVYKAGFATTQEAYSQAVTTLFESLDRVEKILETNRYLLGNQLTEADLRLFTTLVRFDAVYITHFKCDKKRIIEYPNIHAFMREIYQMPGIAETVNLNHIRTHYYCSHKMINPTGIISIGPDLGLDIPHGRDQMKRPFVSLGLDCSRVLLGDADYTAMLSKARIILVENPGLDMSCQGLRQRVIQHHNYQPINYSIAFARDVHENYEYVELQLAATYSPENHYCFSVDTKASKDFQARIRMLAACLPNVYVPPEKHNMDSGGHNINRAHYDCMTILIEQPGWEYLILQQLHDVVLHSSAGMAQVLRAIGGSNDVELTGGIPGGRIDPDQNWTIAHLGLFTNETKMTAEQRQRARLTFAKGYVQASLMRGAVHWITKEMNVEKLIEQLNGKKEFYGVDEQFIATLQASETLLMPGGYHFECRGKNNEYFITRYTNWGGPPCKTKYNRNGQCIQGIEDVKDIIEKTAPNFLMVNKFIPEFDFAGYYCLNEWVFNKTRDGFTHFDLERLKKRPQTRFNFEKKQALIDIYNYTCKP
ncbi:unnamed protein product, partial [Mesorhabditis spiculigera]